MQSLELKRREAMPLVAQVFPEYAGRKFRLLFVEDFTFHDVNWGDGTKNEYRFVNTNGKTATLPDVAPWNNPFEGMKVAIPQDVAIIEHGIFCGQDVGIRILMHPANAPKWLEAK